jgi:hypothetical protein
VTFERYVCWKPEDLGWIAEIDVAGVQHLASEDDSLFLATHQPTKVKETTKDGGQGALVEDDKLLERFKAPISGNHHNFLIQGRVGTGKSHLVKWLHAQCSQEESWHHVYIEKSNTSLRKVIRTILADLSGEKINELREKLEEAHARISDLEEAKTRVLSELDVNVQFGESEAVETQHEKEARKYLPPLLADPYLKRLFLNEQGAVHRITRISYEGLTGDDDERDLFFTEDDLPLDPAGLLEASKLGQSAVKVLARNKSLRDAAVKILNLELARAKARVFIGTGIDLLEVFDEVRKELKNQGLELALYIEDLVVFHGIDRELADALAVGRGKDKKRCGLRTAIAVTDGYLDQGFDTLTSRANHYSLNLNTTDHLDEEFTVSYVARYLNAARVGLDGLTRAHKKAEGGENWLPNACENCEYRPECHDTFGHDDNGYGLYPFNTEAIGRLAGLANGINPPPENFDPREIVRWVVGNALGTASEELPKSEFPSKNFAEVLDPNRTNVAVDVRNDLSEEDHGHRRIALLNFWAPPPVEEITNLKPGIHTAFALPERSNTEIVGPKPPIIVGPKPPPEVDKLAAAIDAWANDDDTLSALNARTVRQFVFDAVVERIRYGPFGRRITGTGRQVTVGHIPFKDTDVRIESAQGGGAELERPFSIKIPRNTKMAVFLKTVLKVADDKGWSGIEAKRFVEATSLLDGWVKELLKASKPRKVDLAPALQLLAITAQPRLSASELDGTEVEVLIQGSSLGGDRTKAWDRWQKKAEKLRSTALRQVEQQASQAKGETGGTSLLDAAQVLLRLRALKTRKELGTKLEGEGTFVEELRSLAEYQSSASTSEWKEVTKLLDRVGDHLTGAKSRDVLVGALEKAVGEAHSLGVLPTRDAAKEVKELADQVDSSVFSTVGRLRKVTDPQAGDLWQLLPDPRGELEALVSYVETAADVIQSLEEHVESGQSGGSGTGDLPALRQDLRELGDLLGEVAGSGAV